MQIASAAAGQKRSDEKGGLGDNKKWGGAGLKWHLKR